MKETDAGTATRRTGPRSSAAPPGGKERARRSRSRKVARNGAAARAPWGRPAGSGRAGRRSRIGGTPVKYGDPTEVVGDLGSGAFGKARFLTHRDCRFSSQFSPDASLDPHWDDNRTRVVKKGQIPAPISRRIPVIKNRDPRFEDQCVHKGRKAFQVTPDDVPHLTVRATGTAGKQVRDSYDHRVDDRRRMLAAQQFPVPVISERHSFISHGSSLHAAQRCELLYGDYALSEKPLLAKSVGGLHGWNECPAHKSRLPVGGPSLSSASLAVAGGLSQCSLMPRTGSRSTQPGAWRETTPGPCAHSATMNSGPRGWRLARVIHHGE